MEFGAHLPLMDFGGHPYTLDHLLEQLQLELFCEKVRPRAFDSAGVSVDRRLDGARLLGA